MKSTIIRFTETIRLPYPDAPRAINELYGYPDGVPLVCADITTAHQVAAAAVLRSFIVTIEARIFEDGSVRMRLVDPDEVPEKPRAPLPPCSKCGALLKPGELATYHDGVVTHKRCPDQGAAPPKS